MIVIVLSIIVALIWGCNTIVNKAIFDNGIDTMLCFIITSILYFVVTIVFLFFYPNKTAIKTISKKGWFLLTTYTLLSVIAFITYLYSIKEAYDINTVAAITCISPIITLILTNIFYKTPINLAQIFGVVLTTIGVCLVIMYSI